MEKIKHLLRTSVFQLIIISTLALFTELAIIRWLSAYILYFGYFSNIILIASFFGLGVGALIGNRRKILFFQFPIFLCAIVIVVATLKINISAASSSILFFQSSQYDLSIPLYVIAPVSFLLISLLFLPLGQKLGILLNTLPPLRAYTWDIVGSLLGIALFTVLSFLGVQPVFWFIVIGILYALLIPVKRLYVSVLFLFIPLSVLVALLAAHTQWSPYYKITLKEITYADAPYEKGYELLANSSGHQTLELPHRKELVYQLPYEVLDTTNIKRILIIGAGGGTDTAAALEHTTAYIDAVEIDPVILSIGRQLHKAQPYAHERVTTHVTDGRAFLEKTSNTYDVIIFALTDSLTLASSYSNTRLESYLYTRESFNLAKEHLTSNGVMVLYNYYRQPWLIQKLASMLNETFNEQPLVYADKNFLALLMAGPGLKHRKTYPALDHQFTNTFFAAATDNWPFLYMKQPALPSIYIYTLFSILLMVLIITFGVIRRYFTVTRAAHVPLFHWHFFWLGAGFLLLETKNIINFSLLFGSTWLVNALVFFAILVAVLAANLLTIKFKFTNQKILYTILGILLLFNLILPLNVFLSFSLIPRYLFASLLTFSPIVLANLIFASSFRKTPSAHLSFGANLLGAVFGGLFEYTALVTGYHFLLGIIIIFYIFSFVSRKKITTTPGDII